MSEFSVSTLDTVQAYLTDARTLLQDTLAPYRYDDASLLTCFNVTILEARRIRADLFVYFHDHDKLPSYSFVSYQRFRMEPQFRLAFVYGIVAHALMRDQEDVDDARASTFMAAFNSMLMGNGAATVVVPPGKGTPVPAGRQ